MNLPVIAHLDLDAFFAAVEQRDNPSLRGQPVIVGADPKGGKGRGVVSTCSYEARKFGIHSAMPISQAYQLCPQAIFLHPDMKKYSCVSEEVFKIMYDFTPDIEPISIDEAFLDITGSFHLFGSPLDTGRQLKSRIKNEIGLTASVGIAPVKFVAKIASDYCKPDGLLEITSDKVLSFLEPLAVGRLWGVGPKTQEILAKMGIRTIGDLAKISAEILYERFGESGLHLHDLAHGIDPRGVAASDDVKSVSHEHTFAEDTSDRAQIQAVLLELSEMVSRRLRKQELKGKTVTLKIRTEGFKTFTRAQTLSERTNYADVLYETVRGLAEEFLSGPPNFPRPVGTPPLAGSRAGKGRSSPARPAELLRGEAAGRAGLPKLDPQTLKEMSLGSPKLDPQTLEEISLGSPNWRKIRLLGVRVSHFEDPYVQENLFKPSGADKKEKVYSAMDQIKNKFGDDALRLAGGISQDVDNKPGHRQRG